MATPNRARFTINGTASEDAQGKRGFDATAGQELTITLEANPAADVLTITYEIYDSTNPEGPLNSLYDTEQLFDENSAKAITLTNGNQSVHITIDAGTEISSYTVRATAVTANGADVFERLVVVRENGLRMTVPAETNQYAQRGWSDALNELTKYVLGLAGGGGGASLVSSSVDGIVESFPASVARIFHSNGVTAGGTWAVLSESDLTAAIAGNAISSSLLKPGSEGQVLKTVGGVVVWATDESGGGGGSLVSTSAQGEVVAFPSGQVRILQSNGITNGGNWNQLTETAVNSAFASQAIDVLKIKPSVTNGQVLKTIGGSVQWASEGGGTGNQTTTIILSGGTTNHNLSSGSLDQGDHTWTVRLDVTGSGNAIVTGFEEGAVGQTLYFVNTDTTQSVQFDHETGSDATKQLSLPGGGSLFVGPDEGATFNYIGGNWKYVGVGVSSTGGDITGPISDVDVIAFTMPNTTRVTFDNINDGNVLVRSGTTIDGVIPGGDVSGDLNALDVIAGTFGGTRLTFQSLVDGNYLRRSGSSIVASALVNNAVFNASSVSGTYTSDALETLAGRVVFRSSTIPEFDSLDTTMSLGTTTGSAHTLHYFQHDLTISGLAASSKVFIQPSEDLNPPGDTDIFLMHARVLGSNSLRVMGLLIGNNSFNGDMNIDIIEFLDV